MLNLSALDAWLKVPTWNSYHPKDDERFYKAIYRLILENDTLIDPDKVKEYIVKYHGNNKSSEYLEDIADKYASRYEVISSFIYENQIKF
ncbi:TPA: hypothetical protein ACXR7G_000198 [Yersinia enterocolitica]